MRRLLGAFVLFFGVVLAAWVLYNLFIQTLPEAQGKNPLPAIAVSAGCIYVGVKWLRDENAG